MREGADTKGRRYLAEGRLTVTRVEGDRVHAECKGQGAVHRLGHDARGWWCSCPARTTCSHLVALQLVVVER